MSKEEREKAKQEFKEWVKSARAILEEELGRLPPEAEQLRATVSRTLKMLKDHPEFRCHFVLYAVASAVVALPHLATKRNILPDPAKAEEWVRALTYQQSEAAKDFLAWKVSTAIRLAQRYARSGVREYGEIVRAMQYMRRDGVHKVVAALLEIDRRLAGEIAPDEKRLRFWLGELTAEGD